MQSSVLKRSGRNLSRGAAVLVLAGMAAGCSSTRFGGIDDFFTASTPNQREIIRPGGAQPYPGNSAMAAAPIEAAPAGAVSRSSLPPAGSSGQMAASAAPAMQPARQLDPTSTGTVASAPVQSRPAAVQSQAAATGDADPKGWSRTGGTQVTVKEGETVYNLSRRFGVPASAIMAANGITESQGLRTGQQIVVPTYVYSSKAPVSAPDSHPKVAAAKSSRGEQQLAAPKTAEQTALAAPKPAAAKPTGAAGTYVVQDGDTVSSIARKTGVSSVALKQANGLTDGAIRIGQSLTIPAGGKPAAAAPVVAAAEAKKTDPVVTSATPKPAQPAGYTPPKKSEVIQQASLDTTPAPEATGIGKMRWPARGRVISSYGKGGGRAGDGIDIAVPEGTSVKAAENGVVIYAGDGLKEFGNTVLVRHENGLVTVYGHASELKVSRGQNVKRGQEIAVSGMSGQTDSPKLHFEVRKNSAPVDPSTYLE
jgi:murein DD-endopeptidase MepM/ murein hydrolase activator NlpD